MEAVRRAVQETDPVEIEPPDQIHRLDAVLDEVIRMRLDNQLQPLGLEQRQQLVQRLEEQRLSRLRRLGPAIELGVDDLHPRSAVIWMIRFQGGYGGLPLLLVRTGPALHGQHRGDAHPCIGGDLLQPPDPGVIDPG